MKLRYDNTDRRAKVFSLYVKCNRKSESYRSMRNDGISAIAVSDDLYATKWQQIQMRLEIMKAYLSNNEPNWFMARWLDYDESKKRNESYFN